MKEHKTTQELGIKNEWEKTNKWDEFGYLIAKEIKRTRLDTDAFNDLLCHERRQHKIGVT